MVILTGGVDLFGAGADIQMLSNLKSSAECYIFTGENNAYPILENLGKPTIASIGGFCLGRNAGIGPLLRFSDCRG